VGRENFPWGKNESKVDTSGGIPEIPALQKSSTWEGGPAEPIGETEEREGRRLARQGCEAARDFDR